MENNWLINLKKMHLLVLGDAFLDEYIHGDTSRISPEAPVPIIKVSKRYFVLGGAANTASNIASLGAKTSLFVITGQDAKKNQFSASCKARNIHLHIFSDGRPTTTKTRIISQNQQILRLDSEVCHPITLKVEREIIAAFQKALSSVDGVVLSDYAKGFFTKTLCSNIIKMAKKAGKIVIVDPRPQNANYYKGCTYVTPNWKEATEIIKKPGLQSKPSNHLSVAKSLSDILRANIILTLGENGLFYYEKSGKLRYGLPTEANEVFDVSGAGDTVVAVFALGVCSGLPVIDSLRVANKAAGAVIKRFGTSVVKESDIIDLPILKSHLIKRADLYGLSEHLKSMGKKIVTINGCFDLLHIGHVHILREARKQGDVLILGLNSDRAVKEAKGNNKPFIKQNQRAEMLLALKYVDYVHIFDEKYPMDFLKEIKPHVHVNGSEYGKNCIESKTIKDNGGRIHIVSKIPKLSTSDIINKIQKLI